jgi:hypothetical protein
MTRLTIITKIRFLAAIAPVVLSIASPILIAGFYLFGVMPAMLRENQVHAMQAADGLESALYQMDWGKTQPDGMEIVRGQQRRFVTLVDSVRAHATTPDQLEKLNQIARTANPIFEAMRKGEGEDVEPRLRELLGMIADLNAANEAAIDAAAARAQSRSRMFIAIAVIAGILVPWAGFVMVYRIGSQAEGGLKAIRGRLERMTESGATAEDLGEIDKALAELGFPKPNPMLAE